MSPDRTRPDENADNGVLDEPGIDTTGIGILGTRTSQVPITMPLVHDDSDDDVVEDDVPAADGPEDGIDAAPTIDGFFRPDDLATGGIVIEVPGSGRGAAVDEAEDGVLEDEEATEPAEVEGELEETDAEAEDAGAEDAEAEAEGAGSDAADAGAEDAGAEDAGVEDAGAEDAGAAVERAGSDAADDSGDVADVDADEDRPEDAGAAAEGAGSEDADDAAPGAEDATAAVDETATDPDESAAADAGTAADAVAGEETTEADDAEAGAENAAAVADVVDDEADTATEVDEHDRGPGEAGLEGTESVPAVEHDGSDALVGDTDVDAVAEEGADHGHAPAPAREETEQVGSEDNATVVPASREGSLRRADATPQSKRLDRLSDADRESADLLTADRLIDPHRAAKPEPEGAWQSFVYRASWRLINLGDSKRVRERKQLNGRISAQLTGEARFVPVLSRKGGVGKTTATALLGMALADARDDRIIAVDANPDRGTLAERVARRSDKTVRDLARARDQITGFNDITELVARDETRLDVLASDADPHVSEAFGDAAYRDVADVAAHYYSIVLTDTGTGIVHDVMAATLDLADDLVIVSGLSVDEARLASETLTWLENNGHEGLAARAVVVLNQGSPGAPLVRYDELERHFRSRVRTVVRLPYDPALATGSAISFRELRPETREAARQLAASVVDGLRGAAA